MSLIHLDESGSISAVPIQPSETSSLNPSVATLLLLVALIVGLLLSGGKRKG